MTWKALFDHDSDRDGSYDCVTPHAAGDGLGHARQILVNWVFFQVKT